MLLLALLVLGACDTISTSEGTTAPEDTAAPADDTMIPEDTSEPEEEFVKLTDPTGDFFDAAGSPVEAEPYLDIVRAEVYTDGSDYVLKITLSGLLPEETPDSQLFFEWDIYVNVDGDASTGNVWPLVTNDLGAEYFARLMLLDDNYWSEVREFGTGRKEAIDNEIGDNTIELRWPKDFSQADTFDFIVAAKKYGERGDGSAFMLADKLPDTFHANFPSGEVLDADGDGFSDEEELSLMNTNPNVAEEWDNLAVVSGLLNTPKKVSLYLDRKFNVVRRPSQLFAVPVTELFEEMSGDCDEFAMLAIYWLAGNGYEAYMVDVYFDKWWEEYNQWLEHDICVYKEGDGLWYYIDIYDHGSGNNPVGPFNSIDEVCDQLPAHYGATDWIEYRLYDSQGSLVETITK